MHPIPNDQTDGLTDNIIFRHFNQGLSSDLFNFQLASKNEPNEHQQSTGYASKQSNHQSNQMQHQSNQIQHQSNQIQQQSNELNQHHNYESDHLNANLQSDPAYRIEQSGQFNENYKLESTYDQAYQFDPKEVILNRNDKIRDLINDCELINNNNINNFVIGYRDQATKPADSLKIVSSDKCHCKCHCTGHKKKNPFHQIIKTNKLLSSLSKIKLNGGAHKSTDHKYADKKSDHSTEDYNTFAPASLSNYSLSSCSSSISSQTISVSSYSSVQDNYNLSNNSNVVLTRPVRKPPLPPPIQLNRPLKPPAKLPPAESNGDPNNEQTNSPIRALSKDYERVITKSFENLLVGIRTADRTIAKTPADLNQDSKQCEESIYETIDSDYEECSNDRDEEEDLYQDIELLDEEEDIYESLSSDLNRSLDLLSDAKDLPKPDEVVYMNNQNELDQNELDRKLMKQQKILDKKRELRADKLRRKFGLTGQEVPLMSGTIKTQVKGHGLHLALNKDETVLVLRIDHNPPGLWLAKNEKCKIGYVDLNVIDVDVEIFKNLMNVLKN